MLHVAGASDRDALGGRCCGEVEQCEARPVAVHLDGISGRAADDGVFLHAGTDGIGEEIGIVHVNLVDVVHVAVGRLCGATDGECIDFLSLGHVDDDGVVVLDVDVVGQDDAVGVGPGGLLLVKSPCIHGDGEALCVVKLIEVGG